MKAMILAAGKGTRVAPFTLDAPKPLLKVLGEPVIDRILGFLKRNHVEDVVLNTSYLGDKLQSYLGDGSRYNMSFTFSYEGVKSNGQMISKPLGSAGGLSEVQQRYGCFDSTFMVICGDAIIDFDLDYALAFHKSRKSLATVLTKEVPWNKVSAYGVVDQTESGQILRFQEKPNQDEAVSNKVSTGIYLFEPEIFDYIPEHGEYDIGGELLPLLARMGEPLHGCETP
ncbi:MAG: nucleotidyltransferase family protein, partial [Pseudomonadales bacterium]|nr:nucleotidyltransferase family protein [Pseudomonadales bacterium]